MKYSTILKYFIIPAIALVVTFWINKTYLNPVGKEKSIGEALIGGKFTLINQDNKIVKDTDFKGKYRLVYFGFTHCPDICPLDVADMSDTMEKLGDDAKKLAPIFITVDPKRDTVDRLKEYSTNFNDKIEFLTGTKSQIDKVAKAYRIYYKKNLEEQGSGNYIMDHSMLMYLMGPEGKYLDYFSHDKTADDIVPIIQYHLKN